MTMAASEHRGAGKGLIALLAARLAAARLAFILLLMATSLAVAATAGWRWFAASRDNATIRKLVAGENVEIDPARASSKVLAARAYYLLKRDRIDEAQVVLDQARFRAEPSARVDMLYNMANARLRVVFDAIEQGQLDKATSLIGLAKDEYVDALRLDPQAWNVKYNLDVTSRLLRDLPEGQGPEDIPTRSAEGAVDRHPRRAEGCAMIRARLNDPRAWLLALALALVVVALFLPRIELTRRAYDVVAIVDVTGSMNVRDLTRAGKPVSRLDYIKVRLPEFVAELPCQSKFGLGIFSERRVFMLFEPVETCDNFSSIDATIAELNWRMAWEGDSHVTEGVHDAIANAEGLKADLLFLTDGHEAPPLPYTGMRPFEGKPGEVKGLIVGVGGKSLSPIPKFDDAGREIGVFAEGDVLQESRAGLPPPGSENRPGYHPKWAPFGAMPHGEEHLSSVKEGHLRAIAAQTGLSYASLDGAEALVQAFETAAKPRQVVVATDIRPYPAGLALALLIVLYGALPIYDRLRSLGYALPRLARPRASHLTLKEAQS